MSDATHDTQWIQKIMDVVHDGLIVLQDEDIVMTNKVFSDMLDYPIKDVIDIALEDIVDPLSRKRDSDLLEKLLSGEATS
ncbi:MAG: PAS domain-containing protein, partial [Candidatus Thorarchaeota archaeon]|nr:PAS domain-containing protein [Candidatus Thorarchaeota archaeon]